jgi:tetratricopeptide (TPR) repeat protein
MAKSKPNQKAKKQAKKMAPINESPEQLYAAALTFIEQQQPQEALEQAQKLYQLVQNRSITEALPALNLLGEISVELGEVEAARGYFEEAVKLDPLGTVGGALADGAEKFLWLAQLAEEGGKQSVMWYEKGAQALMNEIAALESGQPIDLDEEALLLVRVEKKRKLANALCGIVEVYMTDLSWEDDAETRCENLITQAMAAEDETSPEILQTLASVRLSQDKKEDAQAALQRSMSVWTELEPEDPAIPDFPTRISLSRLLMEAELESNAMDVLERLVSEDDESVEAWYLGGWCQHLLAKKAEQGDVSSAAAKMTDSEHEASLEKLYRGSRRWLRTSLKLFELLEYEDERLKQHAEELMAGLDGILGPVKEGEEDVDDEWEDEWDGIEDDDNAQVGADTEMKDS